MQMPNDAAGKATEEIMLELVPLDCDRPKTETYNRAYEALYALIAEMMGVGE
jgi:hypothetical protein